MNVKETSLWRHVKAYQAYTTGRLITKSPPRNSAWDYRAAKKFRSDYYTKVSVEHTILI